MKEAHLIDSAVKVLQGHGLTVTASAADADGPDHWLSIRRRTSEVTYAVETKNVVSATTLGPVSARLSQQALATGRPTLLAASHISPPVAERLKALHQQFVDAAGNAYLEGPDFLIWVTGQKPAKTEASAGGQKTITPAGIKLLFALICDRTLADAPYRTLATAAGIALGAVTQALKDLSQHRYLMTGDGSTRRPLPTRQLLDEWAFMYARSLRPKLLMKTLVAPAEFAQWRTWSLEKDSALWGGEPAAALSVGHLQPGELTLYAHKLPARLMVAHGLKTAAPGAEVPLVEVRKIFWGDTLSLDAGNDCVPPLLIYADLLATGNARCIETAHMIYEQKLSRLFPNI